MSTENCRVKRNGSQQAASMECVSAKLIISRDGHPHSSHSRCCLISVGSSLALETEVTIHTSLYDPIKQKLRLVVLILLLGQCFRELLLFFKSFSPLLRRIVVVSLLRKAHGTNCLLVHI